MRYLVLGAALAALLTSAAPTSGQSLGEVARREAERRKAVAGAGKVFTNDTLRHEPPPAVPVPATPAAPTPADPATPAAGAPASTAAAAGAATQETPADDPKTEPYWRKRMTAARETLSRAESFAEALQTRINVLSAEFVNRDDPAQRNVVAADRQRALAELDRVKQEIATQQKAIVAIRDEARRAGVPIGWVR